MDNALDRWRSSGSTLSYRGHTLFYRVDGRGPPLLAVHGYPLSSWDYSRVWSALTERFTVIAPDLLGFGFSSKPRDERYSIADCADQCEALLATLGVDSTHLVSFDLGTAVAQELLARGAALRSVSFLNGSLFPEVYRPRWIQHLLRSPLGPVVGPRLPRKAVQRAIQGTFGPHTRRTQQELDAFSSIIEERDGLAITHKLNELIFDRRTHRDRWVRAMQQTRVPLRLINGPADPNSGAHMMQRYRALIPGPDIVSVGEHIGHWPLFEAPAVAAAAIIAHAERAERER